MSRVGRGGAGAVNGLGVRAKITERGGGGVKGKIVRRSIWVIKLYKFQKDKSSAEPN